jgi:2-methylisocitrate lyase-like PEP mutase family enzyme
MFAYDFERDQQIPDAPAWQDLNDMPGAADFLALHKRSDAFVLPNAWDPGSAKVIAEAGFPALGTTSAGIAFSAGLPDDGSIGRDRMVERIGAIAAAVDVPVSADIESGYATDPEGVAATIRAVIAAGAVGANLEDADPARRGSLFALDDAVARVEAARAAADSEGAPFTLNARIDSYLTGASDPFADAVQRAARYVAAGADCIFVPGPSDAATIGRLAEAIDAPLNVVAGLVGEPLTLAELNRIGVRRASVGGSLARAALGLVERAAEEMRDGRFDFTAGAIAHAEVNRLMAG